MTEYKTIYKPAGGWCSELHKETKANRVVKDCLNLVLAFIYGTIMIAPYVIKSYLVAYDKFKEN